MILLLDTNCIQMICIAMTTELVVVEITMILIAVLNLYNQKEVNISTTTVITQNAMSVEVNNSMRVQLEQRFMK